MALRDSVYDRRSLLLLGALILAGLAGNHFNFPVLFNLNFLFGSICTMLALQFLGTGPGVIAACCISGYSLFTWNHPFLVLVMTAEAAVVGRLVGRRNMGLLLADTLYWIFFGTPLAYLCYRLLLHLSHSDLHVAIIGLALNGIANTLIARLIFTVYALKTRSRTLTFRDILYNLLALFVLFPALFLLTLGSHQDFDDANQAAKENLLLESQRVSQSLDHWLNMRKAALAGMAELAAQLPPDQMQARLEQMRKTDPHFLGISELDQRAVVVAHAPRADTRSPALLGRILADRPFLPQLEKERQPLLSELLRGASDSNTPLVLVLMQVNAPGSSAGYLAGMLNLERVRAILEQNVGSRDLRFTLVDQNGKVILSNLQDQATMAPFTRGRGTLSLLPEGISRWEPEVTGPALRHLRNAAVYTAQSSVGSSGEWRLILDQPVSSFEQAHLHRFSEKLTLLALIFLGALGCAELLSRFVHRALTEMHQLTRDLPERLAQGQEIHWPERPVLEVRDLMENFRGIATSLTREMLRTREVNENLEQRVAERTAQLVSLNRDFVSFLENTSDFIYFKDEQSRIRFCSQTLAAITGHANWRDLIGKHDLEIFPPELAGIYQEEEVAVFRDGVSLLNKVNPYHDAQGVRGWVSTNKWPLFDASRKVVGIFGISRDITEMIEIQESLRLARLSLDQVPDPILWADPGGRIVDCNAGACQCLGYSHQELIGTSMFSIDLSLDAGNWPAAFAEVRRQRVKHLETSYLTRDGRMIPMDLQVTYLCFGEKELLCGVARDLTQRTQLEEERLRIERQTLNLQKLESLGTLSGGIAHDFNNLLQVVLGNLDLTLMLLPESEPLRRNLEQAVIATVRASELSGMMLAYTGKGVLAVKELNLSTLLQENSPMLGSLIPRNVVFASTLPADLPYIQADATQVLQVVLNLVRNASEAIGDRDGSLTVSAGVQDFDQATLDRSRLDEKLPAGRYVWVEVADTGCGMDQATQDRCFDPFFTTKFTGRGLGMSATLGIVRAHKGGILLKSAPGAGTTVRLLFPLAPGPQADESPPPAQDFSAEPGRPHDTILVVDDEEMVRTLSVATLQAFGFETLVACDGAEALEIFRNEGSRISLVLLDQNMPLMDGQEVFKELRRLRPEVKVLLASGYSSKEVSARFKGLDLNGFIQKPYNVKHLLDEIRRVLG